MVWSCWIYCFDKTSRIRKTFIFELFDTHPDIIPFYKEKDAPPWVDVDVDTASIIPPAFLCLFSLTLALPLFVKSWRKANQNKANLDLYTTPLPLWCGLGHGMTLYMAYHPSTVGSGMMRRDETLYDTQLQPCHIVRYPRKDQIFFSEECIEEELLFFVKEVYWLHNSKW